MRPGLDDKVLADWNGLMIAALANAGLMFGEPSWLELATRAFDFVARRDDPRRPARPFLARRQAEISRARVRLRRHDPRRAGALRGDRAAAYLDRALAWQRALDRDYANADTGTYYLTAADAEGLVIRPGLDRRRGDAQPQCGSRAKSHPACGARRRRRLARQRPTG